MRSVVHQEPRPAPAPRATLASAVVANSGLVLLLVAALLIRVGLLYGTSGLELKIADERDYRVLAHSLVRGDGFAWDRAEATGIRPAGKLTSLRPPLYPFFIATIWTISGTESVELVRVVQIVLALLTIALVHQLGKWLFGTRTALVAAAIVAFYPSLLYAGVLLLTEVLFTFLLLLTAFGYMHVLRGARFTAAAGTGVALGLAALTRSIVWPFPIVLVPLTVLSVRGPLAKRLVCGGLVLAGYLLVVGPWAVRNTRLQGTFTVVDTMGGLNLRAGNYAYTPEDRMWDAYRLEGRQNWAYELYREHPDRNGWTEGRQEQWARGAALGYMRAHPLTTLRRSVLKFADFWGLERELIAALQGLYSPPLWFAMLASLLVTVSYPAVMLLGVFGAASKPPADWRAHAFLLLVVAFVSGLHAIVFGHSRYHLPLIPIIALYAAHAVTTGTWRAQLGDARHAALRMAAAALLVIIWTRELLIRDFDKIARLVGAL